MFFLLIPQGREVVLVVLDKREGGERKDRGGVDALLLFHYIYLLSYLLHFRPVDQYPWSYEKVRKVTSHFFACSPTPLFFPTTHSEFFLRKKDNREFGGCFFM